MRHDGDVIVSVCVLAIPKSLASIFSFVLTTVSNEHERHQLTNAGGHPHCIHSEQAAMRG